MTDPVTEFERYREEILALLGDDDPLDVLSASLRELSALVADATSERLRAAPAPSEWSPWQVLIHLADAEAVFGIRVRMIVTQDRSVIVGYDQDAWTDRFAALDRDPQETFARWQALRSNNLRLYQSLTPEEWERIGVHSERGEQSVREIVRLAAGHDRAHLDQMRRGLIQQSI
jgi:hypothetical protein